MKNVIITKDKTSQCLACHVEDVSDDLKSAIRSRLTSICHGENTSDASLIYSYTETLKEFCKRYDRKSAEIKKGMIGELLAHIIIAKTFPEFKIASPYFNMEEGSVKKGFDLVLFDKNSHRIWITEVKSGEAGESKSDSKNLSLLNTAKTDLKSRLNEQEATIWLNAINGALLALKNGTVKEQINTILLKIANSTALGKATSKDKNVILVSVLYAPLSDKITLDKIKKKREEVNEEKIFAGLIVISMQKRTYQAIAAFLRSEAGR